MLVDRFASESDAIRTQVTQAVAAIQQYAAKKQSELNSSTGTMDLLSDPESVTLSFSLNKIPVKKDYRFHEIVLPHKIMDADKQAFCLLARDPKETAVAAVKANGLPIEKVIAVKSLKRKYTSNESRRELANRFDVFFCESQIFELMGKLLGKYFFETKKSKIPMALKSLSKDCFEKALRTTRFRVRGGAVVGVRIGNRSLDVQELVDNAMVAIEQMATKYCIEKKTMNNIYSISVGATNVIDLPIWSVPIAEVVEPVVATVTTVTPTKKAEKAKAVEAAPPKPVKDIASVPVKELKQLQQARVESAKKQLANPKQAANSKKPRTK